MARLITKNSQTAGAVPTAAQLSVGELAVNTADGRLFTEHSDGSIKEIGASFPSGTKMLFVQTSAPTGWTKDTTHNDKALRVVSGTAGSGGTSAFTTVFQNQTPTINTSGLSAGATTLSTTQIPSHNHSFTASVSSISDVGFAYNGLTVGRSPAGGTTGSSGGGGSHSHSISGSATSSAITLNVQYVDVIIATKN